MWGTVKGAGSHTCLSLHHNVLGTVPGHSSGTRHYCVGREWLPLATLLTSTTVTLSPGAVIHSSILLYTQLLAARLLQVSQLGFNFQPGNPVALNPRLCDTVALAAWWVTQGGPCGLASSHNPQETSDPQTVWVGWPGDPSMGWGVSI